MIFRAFLNPGKTRISVYKKARTLNPNRWSKQIRNWSVISSVGLNCSASKKAVSV